MKEFHTHIFCYKLSSEISTQFLSVSSTQFLRGFLSERDSPGDSRHFCTKTQSFLEKWLNSFLCTWNMSTRFLNSKKIEYWFLIKRFLIEKNVYSPGNKWMWIIQWFNFSSLDIAIKKESQTNHHNDAFSLI